MENLISQQCATSTSTDFNSRMQCINQRSKRASRIPQLPPVQHTNPLPGATAAPASAPPRARITTSPSPTKSMMSSMGSSRIPRVTAAPTLAQQTQRIPKSLGKAQSPTKANAKDANPNIDHQQQQQHQQPHQLPKISFLTSGPRKLANSPTRAVSRPPSAHRTLGSRNPYAHLWSSGSVTVPPRMSSKRSSMALNVDLEAAVERSQSPDFFRDAREHRKSASSLIPAAFDTKSVKVTPIRDMKASRKPSPSIRPGSAGTGGIQESRIFAAVSPSPTQAPPAIPASGEAEEASIIVPVHSGNTPWAVEQGFGVQTDESEPTAGECTADSHREDDSVETARMGKESIKPSKSTSPTSTSSQDATSASVAVTQTSPNLSSLNKRVTVIFSPAFSSLKTSWDEDPNETLSSANIASAHDQIKPQHTEPTPKIPTSSMVGAPPKEHESAGHTSTLKRMSMRRSLRGLFKKSESKSIDQLSNTNIPFKSSRVDTASSLARRMHKSSTKPKPHISTPLPPEIVIEDFPSYAKTKDRGTQVTERELFLTAAELEHAEIAIASSVLLENCAETLNRLTDNVLSNRAVTPERSLATDIAEAVLRTAQCYRTTYQCADAAAKLAREADARCEEAGSMLQKLQKLCEVKFDRQTMKTIRKTLRDHGWETA